MRDIAAAQDPLFARAAEREGRYDVEKDVAAYLQDRKDAADNMSVIQVKIAELLKQNNEALAGLRADVRAIVEAMRQGGKTALDDLMEGVDLPRWADRSKRFGDETQRDQEANRPVFGGLPMPPGYPMPPRGY